MNTTWTQQYGFGAARLPLRAPALRPEEPASLADATRQAPFARVGAAACCLLCGFLLWLMLSPAEDAGPLQIVMLDTQPNAQPEPHVEPPPPVPEKAPEPAEKAPEPEIVVAEEAPPLPEPAPQPAPARAPEPPAPKIERVVKVEPVRAPQPEPAAVRPTRSARPAPTIAGLAAPRLPTLAAPTAPEPFDVAGTRAPRRERAIRKRLPGAPPAPAPANLAPVTSAARPARTARARPERRSSPPAAARPRALPAARTTEMPAPAAAPQRAARPAPTAPQRSVSIDPKLRGVALGSLASCVSDREEDALKQRLIRHVSRPGVCSNAQGTWSFVETKNLNAFLMWVDRGKQRAGDRCAELTRALACVKQHGVRES